MTTTPVNLDFCRLGTSSGDSFVFGPLYIAVRADLVFGWQNMTPPARVAITDPAGIGDVIYVTQEKYDSIEETASIITDKKMMDAIRQSEIDIANGNTITNDALRAKLGL